MLAFRVIARLDIKGENVVKGIQMEGLRIVGKPNVLARKYAEEGADEILYIDTVASLYGRSNLEEILQEAAEGVFIPITAGGGIRSVHDARRLFNAGADKVALNTAALERPALIDELAHYFGRQAICVHVDAKRVNGHWEAYANCGRDPSGRDAEGWIIEAAARGAGEILLTSIDRDGTNAGPDLELAAKVRISVPLVLAGGISSPQNALQAARASDAIAVGSALHSGRATVSGLKKALADAGKAIR